jgi:hypothetical protein
MDYRFIYYKSIINQDEERVREDILLFKKYFGDKKTLPNQGRQNSVD